MLSKRYELTEVDPRTWLHMSASTRLKWSPTKNNFGSILLNKRKIEEILFIPMTKTLIPTDM